MGFQARAPDILLPPGTHMTKQPGSQFPRNVAASGWAPAAAMMACLSCWNDFRLFNLLPEISKITNRLRAKLRTKHPCQGENKGLMESLIHSLKMATSKDDNLLWMRPQPGGNTLQRFLQRRNFKKQNPSTKAQTETLK